MERWFKPLRSKPVERTIMAFDIEGAGGDAGLVCGVISSGCTYNFFTNRADMWDTAREYATSGSWVFSFNLEYDLPILAGDDLWSGNLIFTKTGLLFAEYLYKGKSVKFYDAANLFPRWSVKTIGQMLGCPKLELPADLLKRLSKGDPFVSFDPEQQRLIERYCARDAEIVYKAVMEMQELSLNLGGQLHPTIAGISMDIFRRRFHRWPWPTIGEEVNRTARQGYYGGRCENFAFGKVENVNMYDVTSLYPYVQSRVKFPHPGHLEFDINPKLLGEWWKWEGVVNAKVKVPDTFMPSLPCRHDDRLFFPVGTLNATWTIWELREAVNRGVKLIGVNWAFGSKITFNPFTDFIENLFGLRDAYLFENSHKANLVKLILNSLYGRFGINTDDGLSQMKPVLANTDLDTMQGWATKELGGYMVGIGKLDTMRYPTYANAFFAAQVTSAGRIELLEGLEGQGEQASYCDTDSIITTGVMQTSADLGGWREEAAGVTVDLHGPKEYALYDKQEEPKYVVKSIPQYEAAKYLSTGHANFSRAVSIREAVNRGLAPADWAEIFYSRQMNYPKRAVLDEAAYSSFQFSSTRPWHFSELPGAVDLQAKAQGLSPLIAKPLYPPRPL